MLEKKKKKLYGGKNKHLHSVLLLYIRNKVRIAVFILMCLSGKSFL